jgi:hypothetical protein
MTIVPKEYGIKQNCDGTFSSKRDRPTGAYEPQVLKIYTSCRQNGNKK